ncbi:MAG TPA: helix-turn-helix transcriptional regulator [Ktedonobacteraceae bacterium]|nr:helix-turn-helix transcriptional regulator [Ktedonobacteraceae bacterium]
MRQPIAAPFRKAVEQQDTLPLPAVKLVSISGGGLLTLRQVRERCGLNQVQLARAAGVRPIVVDWCERDRAVKPAEAAQILAALARCLAGMPTRTACGLWEGKQS